MLEFNRRRPATTLRGFASDQAGGVALVFALALIPLAASVGVAVDYSRSLDVQATLQQDLDAALLRIAKKAESKRENFDWASAIGESYETLGRVDEQISTVQFSADARNGTIVATAATTMPTTMMRIVGFRTVDIVVRSAVSSANSPVNVALVLDNTDSMVGAKLAAVQSASNLLIDVAYQEPGSQELVKIGIVPFADYINVGLQHRNASWIKDTNDRQVVQNIPGYWTRVGIGCMPGTERTVDQIVGYTDGVPIIEQRTMCDPLTYEDRWVDGYDVVTDYIWKGCVGPRPYPAELEDGSYTSERVPGHTDPAVTCPSPITPLSNDAGVLRTAVSALAPKGQTYIPMGVLWGERVLSEVDPFAEAQANGGNAAPRKIMILMTDGANTIAQGDHWGPSGETNSVWLGHRDDQAKVRANAVLLDACAAAKEAGTEIIVVGFEVANDDARQLLRQCGNSYYEAANADELINHFETIATSFPALRLTQ